MRRALLIAGGLVLGFAAFRVFAHGTPADPEASDVQTGLGDLFSAPPLADMVSALDNPNLRAFLLMIRAAEGTDGPDGYRTIVGGGKFDSFEDHPRVRVPFTQTDGKQNFSTAAGAYQFTMRTWDDLAAKLELQDFSPDSQDAGAVELLRERRALDDIQAGRFDDAVAKVNTIWASLPGSPYPQHTRTPEFVLAAYQRSGGELA